MDPRFGYHENVGQSRKTNAKKGYLYPLESGDVHSGRNQQMPG